MKKKNRNDIVDTLDGAGIKGTFFFSKPAYYSLCPAVFTDSIQTATTVRLNLALAYAYLEPNFR